jgi:hypothetical protein
VSPTSVARALFAPFGSGVAPVVPAVYDGADIMAAITAWWRAHAAVQLISSDKNLWHKTAPEGAELPYSTFFLVHEGPDTYTTAFAFMRSNVQVNCHASTDVEARAAANAIRVALKQAPLSIGGVRVLHVLPDPSGLQVGEGLGPGGKDCWIAFQAFDIAWTD